MRLHTSKVGHSCSSVMVPLCVISNLLAGSALMNILLKFSQHLLESPPIKEPREGSIQSVREQKLERMKKKPIKETCVVSVCVDLSTIVYSWRNRGK